jgi:hypothetical protein
MAAKTVLTTALADDSSVGAVGICDRAAVVRRYVEELEPRGEPPWRDEQALARWKEGTAVDLVGE